MKKILKEKIKEELTVLATALIIGGFWLVLFYLAGFRGFN